MKKAIVLQKPSGTIAIGGDLNALERKFYNAFLYVGKKELEKDTKKDWFEVKLIVLKRFFGLEDDKNNQYFKDVIIRNLVNTTIEYNMLGKDKTITGIATALNNVEIVMDNKTQETTIRFSLPIRVKEALINKNEMYASIDLVIIKGLKSKYSVILYEICKDYEKARVPVMSMDKFRKIFGVENKYKKMPDLRKFVLDSACEELNNNPDVGFTVSYELVKSGKSYQSIRFYTKTKPLKYRRQLQPTEEFGEQFQSPILMDLIPQRYQTRPMEKYIANCLNEYDADYLRRQIEYVNSRDPKEYFSYLKQAIKEDYANNEEAVVKEKIEREKQRHMPQIKRILNLKAMKRVLLEVKNGRKGYLYNITFDKDNNLVLYFDGDDNSNSIFTVRIPILDINLVEEQLNYIERELSR